MLASHRVDMIRWHVFAICSACCQAIVIELLSVQERDEPHRMDGVAVSRAFTIGRALPAPPRIHEIDMVPDNVNRSFLQAETAFAAGHRGSAALNYRTTIERALKHLDEKATGSLSDRIHRMTTVLPKELIRLLHIVRFLGNDAAHEDDDPPADEVDACRDFVRLFLIYTFDLPARINVALAKRMLR